jgi:hypothetical protein
MSELAERFEVLVEAFARKIAALAIDAGEQKGRADRAEAEVDRLRREYEPGYPVARDASVDAPVLDDERKELCDEINKWKSRYFRATDVMAAEKKRADAAERERDALRAELAALGGHMIRNDCGFPPSGTGRALAARVSLLETVARFLDYWSQWALNSYVSIDSETRANLRALREHLGLEEVDGVESWEVSKLYDAMTTAREKLAALDDKGGGV